MAKPTKRKIDGEGSSIVSKRVTPKATASSTRNPSDHPGQSTRYTPPTARYDHAPSPRWVPILMFTLLGAGLLMIILNYMDLVPGQTSGWYLLGGLALILGGIMTATQYR